MTTARKVENVRAVLLPLVPKLPDDAETDLFKAGAIDSLKLLEIVMALEDAYGVLFLPPDLVAENFSTLSRIMATVQGLQQRA